MTDVHSGQSQFVLLTDNRRRWFDGRTLFLLIVVTVPIIIFCGIYTIILKGNEALLYPQSNTKVPLQLQHRAKAYALAKTPKYDLHIPDDRYDEVKDFKLVCYYNFPHGDSGDLLPEHIDPFLCTHINVGFASISNNTVSITDDELRVLSAVVDLKTRNPDLKVLLSVGGAGDNGGFAEMIVNHANRKAFIHSVVLLVKKYKIDGVDLDWEFPNEIPNHDGNQKMHFSQLLEEIRLTINKQARHKFLLSVAVAAPVVIVENSYDVLYLDEYVDFVNVMTYDFHFFSKITPFTGLNSPLYESRDDKGYFTTLNINYTLHYWMAKGMRRSKIMVGLPAYGHSFRLTNSHNKGLYAPARGYGKLGGLGFVDYATVCKFLDLNQISPVFDLGSRSPYATKGSEWVSFDNEQSLSFKAEFMRDYHFGGVMVYSLNADDHTGACKYDPRVRNKPFPLIGKIKEILDKNYSIS